MKKRKSTILLCAVLFAHIQDASAQDYKKKVGFALGIAGVAGLGYQFYNWWKKKAEEERRRRLEENKIDSDEKERIKQESRLLQEKQDVQKAITKQRKEEEKKRKEQEQVKLKQEAFKQRVMSEGQMTQEQINEMIKMQEVQRKMEEEKKIDSDEKERIKQEKRLSQEKKNVQELIKKQRKEEQKKRKEEESRQLKKNQPKRERKKRNREEGGKVLSPKELSSEKVKKMFEGQGGDLTMEQILQRIDLMNAQEQEKIESKFPKKTISIGGTYSVMAREGGYKGKEIYQIHVLNQFEKGGGGDASCGYHALKNGLILAWALLGKGIPQHYVVGRDEKKALQDVLDSKHFLKDYFADPESLWRKPIITKRWEKYDEKLKQYNIVVTDKEIDDEISRILKKEGKSLKRLEAKDRLVDERIKTKDQKEQKAINVFRQRHTLNGDWLYAEEIELLYKDKSAKLLENGIEENVGLIVLDSLALLKKPYCYKHEMIKEVRSNPSNVGLFILNKGGKDQGLWFTLVHFKGVYYVLNSHANGVYIDVDEVKTMIDAFESFKTS